MRLLRHPAASFWVVLSVLGLIVLAGALSGGSGGLHQRPEADHFAEVAAVAAFRHEVAELVVLSVNPDERLTAWTDDASVIVQRAAAARDAAEGADDPLTRSWRAASADVAAVGAIDPGDSGASDGAVRRLIARADELAFLVSPGGATWDDEGVLIGGDRPTLTTVTPSTFDVPAPGVVVAPTAPPLG